MVHKTNGIIVRQRDLGESDKIVTVITHDKGKLSVVAKGARKPTSKKSSLIDLGNHCEFRIATTKGLGIITETKLIKEFQTNSLNQNLLAFYIFELCDKLLSEEEKEDEVFELLDDFVSIIIIDITRIELFFVLKLLLILGFLAPENADAVRIQKILKFYTNSNLREAVKLNLNQEDTKILRKTVDSTLENIIDVKLKAKEIYLQNLRKIQI